MADIIIDIETLGTKPGCVILEIGACAMDPRTGRITANFSRRIKQAVTFTDLLKLSLYDHCDKDLRKTVAWWTEDMDKSILLHRILSGGVETDRALKEFADWFGMQVLGHTPETVRIWANGPAFDIAILKSAYDGYGFERPWVCWQERCVRTALEQAGYERGSVGWIERGPRHRALNDARHEARKLYYSGALGEVSAIINRLRQRGCGNFKVEGK